MRKLLISIVAPLLMLMASQAAFVHSLAHLPELRGGRIVSPPTVQATPRSGTEDTLCLLCLAFSSLACVVTAFAYPVWRAATLRHVMAGATAVLHRAASAPQPRACGPPCLL